MNTTRKATQLSQCLYLSLILLLLMSTTVNSQSGITNFALTTPQASLILIGADAMAAGGTSVAESGLSTVAFTNPAGMRFGGITAYAEFGKYTSSKWFGGFDYNGQPVLPVALSVGMPIGDISLALSYFRQYSNRLTSPPIGVTTEASPDEIGKWITLVQSIELHSFCGSGSVDLSKTVSVGLTFGGNYFKFNEHTDDFGLVGSDWSLFVNAGAQLRLDERFTVGASIRYIQPFKYQPEASPQRLLRNPLPGFVEILDIPAVEVRFPPIGELGISWQALPQLTLLASTEFQNWTTALNYSENRWQFHFGGIVDIDENLGLRLGFFTLSNATTSNKKLLDQQFLTFGLKLKLDPMAFSLSVMDSHLFRKSASMTGSWPSSEPFYQTYFSSGVSFTF